MQKVLSSIWTHTKSPPKSLACKEVVGEEKVSGCLEPRLWSHIYRETAGKRGWQEKEALAHNNGVYNFTYDCESIMATETEDIGVFLGRRSSKESLGCEFYFVAVWVPSRGR